MKTSGRVIEVGKKAIKGALLFCLLACGLCPIPRMVPDAAATAAPTCTVVQGKQVTPAQAPNVECPTPPCAPNGCTYDSVNHIAGGPNGSCAITACVSNGDDPPLEEPTWDESSMGFMSLGSSMTSGKCSPGATYPSAAKPTAFNNNRASLNYNPMLICPYSSGFR